MLFRVGEGERKKVDVGVSCDCSLWHAGCGELSSVHVWESWLGRGREIQCLTTSFPWNIYQCHSRKLLEIATIIWLSGQCCLVFIPDKYYHMTPPSSSAQRLPAALRLPFQRGRVIILRAAVRQLFRCCQFSEACCCSYSSFLGCPERYNK